jgi:hypothetical protein
MWGGGRDATKNSVLLSDQTGGQTGRTSFQINSQRDPAQQMAGEKESEIRHIKKGSRAGTEGVVGDNDRPERRVSPLQSRRGGKEIFGVQIREQVVSILCPPLRTVPSPILLHEDNEGGCEFLEKKRDRNRDPARRFFTAVFHTSGSSEGEKLDCRTDHANVGSGSVQQGQLGTTTEIFVLGHDSRYSRRKVFCPRPEDPILGKIHLPGVGRFWGGR